MMHILSLKKKTKHLPIIELNAPDVLYLPLQGFRDSLELIVKPGETVKKYQLVAQSTGLFSSKLHAPVSGVAESIETINGEAHLKIINDHKDDEVVMPSFSVDGLDGVEILKIIKDYGIEGSGGARFPTHLKYTLQDKKITTLIINGAECEPYLSADYALMKNETESLLKAITIVHKLVKADRVIIAIEKQHKELVSVFKKYASTYTYNVNIKLLPNEYPQGGELQLIKSVTGKELPKGSLPATNGVLVTNTGTLWAIYRAFYENKPYTERVITVSGEKALIKGNYRVKIGTPASFLLKELGTDWDKDNQTVVFGGPMMGKAVHNPDTSVNKGAGGVLIIPHTKTNSYNCIQCGYCSDVCPQRLMPMEFARAESINNKERLTAFNLNDCIECGACAYICPSDVPLMQSIFAGKKVIQTV